MAKKKLAARPAPALTFKNFLAAMKNFKDEILSEIRTELQKKPNRSELADLLSDVGEIREQMAMKPDRKEFESILHRELNKAAEITLSPIKNLEDRTENHERRIATLEASIPPPA